MENWPVKSVEQTDRNRSRPPENMELWCSWSAREFEEFYVFVRFKEVPQVNNMRVSYSDYYT